MNLPRLVSLAAIIVVVAALFLAKGVLVPVALAIFVSFVLSPMVMRLERWRFGRVPSVLLVVLLAGVLVGSVGWVVGREAFSLMDKLPQYRTQLVERVALIRKTIQSPLRDANELVQELGNATDPAAASAPAPVTGNDSAAAARTPGPLESWLPIRLDSLVAPLATAGVVLLLVVLMLLQRADLRDRFIALAGGGGVVVTTQALDEGARRLSRYLLVISAINTLHGTAMGTALWMLGVPNALLWGLLAGVLRFVPYLGSIIAGIFPIVLSFAIGDSVAFTLAVMGVVFTLELITANVVEPLVMPNHVGVSSPALVVSAVFWTWLWGIPGLVLATPLTVCVAVMAEHVPQMRFLSVLLGDRPVLSPSQRLYQRLLVADADDAWNLLAPDFKEGRSLVEVADLVLLPALCLAERDRRDHVIDDATMARICESMRELIEEARDRRKPEEPPPVPARQLRVVCLPAGRVADAVAAALAVDALAAAGASVREIPPGALVAEEILEIERAQAEAVVVSQLPPLSFSRLRYLCKRLGAHRPEMPIVIGTWTVTLDPEVARERLQSDGDLHFAGSLSEMQTQIRQIESVVRSTDSAPGSGPTPSPRSAAPAAPRRARTGAS